MIPRLKAQLGASEIMAALTLRGAQDLEDYEQAFAQTMGQRHAVAFPYGRTGLMLLLEAMGLQGKEIICPAYTCVVVPHAIMFSQNKPVFVDSQSSDFNMDLGRAASAITSRTGALVATSLFGYPVDLDALAVLKSKHPDLKIIQDCAHSFSAAWNGRQVQQAGDAAVFGLNISKIVTSVFGGMITTDDQELATRLRTLRAARTTPGRWLKSFKRLLYLCAVIPAFWEPLYGWVNRMERSGLLDLFTRYYDESKIDMPADHLIGLTGLEARVGRANLRRYLDLLARRRAAAECYQASLSGRTELQLPPLVQGATYSHYVVRVQDREAWLRKGLQSGVQLGTLIEYNIPEMGSYGGASTEAFPVAADLARHTINLPVWGGEAVARRVVAAIT